MLSIMNLNKDGSFEAGLSALENGIDIVDEENYVLNLFEMQNCDNLSTLLRMFKDPKISFSASIRLIKVFLAISH